MSDLCSKCPFIAFYKIQTKEIKCRQFSPSPCLIAEPEAVSKHSVSLWIGYSEYTSSFLKRKKLYTTYHEESVKTILIWLRWTVLTCARWFVSPRNALRWGYSNAAVVPSVSQSVRPWFRPCVDLVNTIETTPLHISLSNLADMLTMTRGWTLLILEVRGQRSRSQWTYMEI